MVRHEGGRWDVGVRDAAVYVERISDSDERLFEDSLAAEEARDLAGLLTKYADKLDEARDADKAKESNDAEESDTAKKSDNVENTESSDKAEKTDESEDSDQSDESENSDKSDKSSE
jgi:hypothetical protein